MSLFRCRQSHGAMKAPAHVAASLEAKMRGIEREIEFYCERVRTHEHGLDAYRPGAIEFRNDSLIGRMWALAARLRRFLGGTRRV